MNEARLLEIVSQYAFFVWFVLAGVLLIARPFRGRKRLAIGFALLGTNSLVWWGMIKFASEIAFENEATIGTVTTVTYLGAVLLIGLGILSLARGGLIQLSRVAVSDSYHSYATDELIARHAERTTVNDDLDKLIQSLHSYLKRFVDAAPQSTSLTDVEKYSRELYLERFAPMGRFNATRCGQLRQVKFHLAGPGDDRAWGTLTVTYVVDQAPVGESVVENTDLVKRPGDLRELREGERLTRFLETGVVRRSLEEKFEELITSAGRLLLIPIQVGLLAAGIVTIVSRKVVAGRRPRVRLIPTSAPQRLPFEFRGLAVNFWFTVLEEQAKHCETLTSAIRQTLSDRLLEARYYEKEIVQWGGFTLKEVRNQSILELRRAQVYVGIYSYGEDLYIRWDSHVNGLHWTLSKYPYSHAVGYVFPQSPFSWVTPLFRQVPDLFEYSPSVSRITDFDWADLDALQELVHGIVTKHVKKFMKQRNIEKEIEFAIYEGSRQEVSKGAEQSPVAKRPKRVRRIR